MSELQLALIAVGIALVVAVFAYNKWQEARFRRQTERGLKPEHSDVLLRSTAEALPAGGRVEPTLAEDPIVAAAAPAQAPQRADAATAAGLSQGIDFIVTLECPAGLAGSALLQAARQPLARFRKAVLLEGEGALGWEGLAPETVYRRMRIGMQLVDRRGAAAPEDIAAFAAAVQEAAAAVGASASPASIDAALETAGQLDRLCEQVDIQIAVHVVSREALFPGTKVRALAEAGGLALDEDGRFRRRDDDGRELFSLTNGDATPFSAEAMKAMSTAAVSLELDVPRVPGGADALRGFREFAEQLAAALHGAVVDDNRAPLTPSAFEAIAVQLQPVYEAMQASGIPAGSPLALRLFS